MELDCHLLLCISRTFQNKQAFDTQITFSSFSMWQEISMYKIQLPHKTSMQYFLTEHYDGRKKNPVSNVELDGIERLMHQKKKQIYWRYP